MTQFPSPHEDEAMRRLLHEAVDDVEPRDSLHEIRSRSRSRSSSRPWVWGVGGAVVASAATVAAIAVLGGPGGTTASPDPSFADSPAATATSEPTPTQEPSATPAPPPVETTAVPVYYVGDTPYGPRLYREFQEAPEDDALGAALGAAVGHAADGSPVQPEDPDYRTAWPLVTSVSGSFDGDVITVDLRGSASDLRTRPGAMTEREAQLAVEQLIYTAQGVVQERAPVQLLINGQHTDQVLGIPASEPLVESDPIQTLALAQVTTPAQGEEVSGSFVAEGIASSFEATVPWEIRQGDEVVLQGVATAEGWMDKLYPWTTEPIDVSELAPGEYTFVAMTSDPSGGAEGNGPYQDTKLIVVQ